MEGLTVKQSKNGKGVFALRQFSVGDEILVAKGDILDAADIVKGSYVDDHSLQIDERTYLGSSGDTDDYINHSCDPNAGYKIKGETAKLVAIKDIQIGDEIRYDYSTALDGETNFMTCDCGAKECRRTIKNFVDLPKDLQQKYIDLQIVQEFILRKLML